MHDRTTLARLLLGTPLVLLLASLPGPGCGADVDDGPGAGAGPACSVEGEQQPCYPGPPTTREVGLCVAGSQICSGGAWSDCAGYVLPQDEICDDALDQNCDGSSDDGCPCPTGEFRDCYAGPPATLGIGKCRGGVQQCVAEIWADCVGAVLPSEEICNGVDDDCDGDPDSTCGCLDGQTAECFTGPPGTLGVGVCEAGTRTCTGGIWPPTCAGEVTPDDEACDGDDDDCDGVIDDDPCLGVVYRFTNQTTSRHMYKLDDPNEEFGFDLDTYTQFRVYRTEVPGTVQLYLKSDGDAYMLTTDEQEAASAGFSVWGYVGFIAETPFPAAGFTTTVLCRGTNGEDYVVGSEAQAANPPEGWETEFCLGSVWDYQ